MKKYRFFSALMAVVLSLALLPAPAAALDDPDIQAQHVILLDGNYDEVLYDKAGEEKAYPASITKVMTALLVMEAIDAGQMTADTMITASETSQQGLSIYGSTQNIKPGETMSVKDLLYCLLVPSANEAANILAEAVDGSVEEFVAHMNRKAGELGCQGTHFANPHGLHNDDHYTTALDLAHIVKAAMEYDLFRQIVYTSVYETTATNMSAPRTFYNTNGLITQWRFRGYLYDKAIGVKTGSTDEAGYCLASAAQDGDDYLIAVVLGAQMLTDEKGNITDRQQFSESKRLLKWGFANFQRTTITKGDSPVASVKVTLSREREDVMVRPVGSIERTLPRDLDQEQIESRITLFSDTVEAPVTAGQVLGTMTLTYDGQVLGTLDLVADTDVSRSELLYKKAQFLAFWHSMGGKLVLAAVIVVVCVLVWLLAFRRRRRPGRRSYAGSAQGRGNYRGGRR